MTIRFAIVGCGTIAPMHAEAIGRTRGAELVAVASRRPETAQAFAAARGIAWEPDLISLLRRPDVDAVTICTPSGLHAEMAVAAMRAGKHAVVDKPLAITLEQADWTMEVSCQTGRQLAVMSQLRFASDVLEAKRAMDGGRLGRVLLADLSMKYFRSQAYYDSAGWRGTWALDGGGALMNQGIHGIDLLIWLAGMPRTIYGCARTLARRIEVEDTAVAVADLADGGLATITGTTSVAPGFPRRLAIHGERGSIVLEETRIVVWQIEGEPERAPTAAPVLAASRVPTALGLDEFASQYQAIVDSLHEGRQPPVSAEEARRAVAVVLAIYQSSRTGRPVPMT